MKADDLIAEARQVACLMTKHCAYHAEPVEDVAVYGKDRKLLGSLVQKVVSGTGEVCYGILRFTTGLGAVFVPVPWTLMHFLDEAAGYVTDLDHLALLEAPHLKFLNNHAFDGDFAARVDAAYGMEFPGIETFNDFA